MKRLALIIALMMVLSSTDGCSRQAEDANAVGTETAAGEPITGAYHYSGEVVSQLLFSDEVYSYYSNVFIYDGSMTATRTDFLDTTAMSALYNLTYDESKIIEHTLEEFNLESNEGIFVSTWTIDESGNTYIIYSNREDNYLRVINVTGEVTVDLLPLAGVKGNVEYFEVYNDTAYIGYNSRIHAYTIDGKPTDLGVIPAADYYIELESDFKGGLYLITPKENTSILSKYDLNTGEFVYKVEYPATLTYDLLYDEFSDSINIATNTNIIRVNASDGTDIREEVSYDKEVPYIIELGDTVGGYRLGSMASDTEGSIYLDLFGSQESIIYKLTKVPGEIEEQIADIELTITSIYPQPYIEEAAMRYVKSHPDVKITWDVQYSSAGEGRNAILQGQGEPTEKLLVKLMANDVGDIVAVGGMNFDMYSLLKTDVFIDLKDYIENDKSYPDLNKSAISGTMIDNQIKGLPLGLALYHFVYNFDLLDGLGLKADPASPMKWSELLQFAIDNPVDNNEVFFFMPFQRLLSYIIAANIPDLIETEEKSINLRQEWFTELIMMTKELYNTPNSAITDLNIEINYMDYAFFDTNDILNMTSVFYPSNTYGVYPMLKGEVNDNKIRYPHVMCSISANSTKQQEAWDFLSFMVEADQQAMQSLYGAPVNLKGLNQAFDGKGRSDDGKEQARVFTENIDYTYDFYAYRDDIVIPVMQYLTDELTLDEALELAEENVIFRLNE